MGQIVVPGAAPSIILTAVDRLVAANADGGMSPLATHIILLGEDAGESLGPLTNVIVLGWDSLSGGIQSLVQNGTVVIGGQSLSALLNTTLPVNRDGPIVAIGQGIIPAQISRVGADVMIGASIGALAEPLGAEISANVLIGNDVIGRQRILAANSGVGTGIINNVIIGDRAARGSAFTLAGAGAILQSNIIIGAEAMENAGFDAGIPGVTIQTNVAIGRQALRAAGTASGATCQANVAIGNVAASALITGTDNVFIGSGVSAQTTGLSGNVFIGANLIGTIVAGAGNNTAIGAAISMGGVGSRNIVLGTGADLGSHGNVSDRLLVETGSGGTVRTLIYGILSDASPGGIVLGDSSLANRDVPGFNIVKIIDGSSTGVAPVGGGFFTSIAGELHWRSTANIDYAITPGASRGIFTVGTLPVPGVGAVAGNTAFVTDALAPAFGAAVAGVGAVFVPVFCTGAAWNVG